MDSIIYLVFRNMRQPLLTLLVVYAVAVFGLTVIPGVDADGNPWHMSIFHAFYFVSYMATTIGFGEIPYEFTDAQRLWVSLSLYAAVVAWIYAFGTILALVQDKTFQEAIAEIENSTGIYGDVDFGTLTSNAYRFRFYVDPNGSPLYIAGGRVVAGPRQVLEALGEGALATAESVRAANRPITCASECAPISIRCRFMPSRWKRRPSTRTGIR